MSVKVLDLFVVFFPLRDVVSKSMYYEVSGFIDCMRFKSIFTKPTFNFHDSVNVMLASIPELFLCLILSSMRPWNLKSFFFFFYQSWILFTRVSGMKGSCVVLCLRVLSLKGRKLSHGLSRFCKYRCVSGTLSWIQGCLDFEWQPWREDYSSRRDLCPKSRQTSVRVHSTHM